jgi:hypothetical protein
MINDERLISALNTGASNKRRLVTGLEFPKIAFLNNEKYTV